MLKKTNFRELISCVPPVMSRSYRRHIYTANYFIWRCFLSCTSQRIVRFFTARRFIVHETPFFCASSANLMFCSEFFGPLYQLISFLAPFSRLISGSFHLAPFPRTFIPKKCFHFPKNGKNRRYFLSSHFNLCLI